MGNKEPVMNNQELIAKLKELDACPEAIDFAGNYTLKQAWQKCERADWMLWFMCKTEMATKRERIHVICDCAATSLKYVSKGEDRPRLAIEAARRYADEPTKDNLRLLNVARAAAEAAAWAAAGAAWAAARAAAEAAAWAAAGAAWAAARAAEAAAWAAARAAAEAAAWAAAGAAWAAARAAAHKKMCCIIREKIKV